MSKRRPWDKRDDESTKSYAAFCKYRDLGHERSLTKVTDGRPSLRRWWSRWSTKYEWVARSQEWDVAELERMGRLSEHIQARALTRLANAAEDMVKKLVSMGLGEDPEVVGHARVKACVEGLAMLGIVGAKRVELTGANGSPVQVESRHKVELSMEQVRQLYADPETAAAVKVLAVSQAKMLTAEEE